MSDAGCPVGPNDMEKVPVMIGIDGGATNSFGVAVDSEGRVVASSRSGSLYFFGTSLAESRRNLTDLIRTIELQLPLGNYPERVVMGNAALFMEASEREKEILCRGIVPLDRTRVVGDSIITFHGASLGKPGILVVSGTGSIVLIQNEQGQYFQTGGWGHLLGDEGGAYWIAVQSIKAAIAAVDGRGTQTGLVGEICKWFDVKELSEILPLIYTPKFSKDKLAALSEHLALTLREEDPGFNEVCRRGGEELARQTLAGASLLGLHMDPVPIYLHGGVISCNRLVRDTLIEGLAEHLPVKVMEQALHPILGAALMAMIGAGITPTPKIVNTLSESYAAHLKMPRADREPRALNQSNECPAKIL